jgi:hypothetical protein
MLPDLPEASTVSAATVSCLCDGLVCDTCEKGRVHRPISNYYDEASGHLIHVPYFMCLRRCPECGGKGWRAAGEGTLLA